MAKITADLEAQILALSVNNSNRQIEEILSKQKIKLSNVSIGKIINKHRKERAEGTKVTVNEYIKKTVTTDLEILEDQRDRLYAWFISDELRIGERLACSDRLNKVIDTRLKYSGAGDNDKDSSLADELKAARERAKG